jgi:hypothetical protein
MTLFSLDAKNLIGKLSRLGLWNLCRTSRPPATSESPVGLESSGLAPSHHDKSSTWEKVRTANFEIAAYKNQKGFELIAQALHVVYPARVALEAENLG